MYRANPPTRATVWGAIPIASDRVWYQYAVKHGREMKNEEVSDYFDYFDYFRLLFSTRWCLITLDYA